MKMRKLFAGIAAAATLLGGMVLGAASAQADDAATPVTDERNVHVHRGNRRAVDPR